MNTLELEYQLAENQRLQLKYRVCYANAAGNADGWRICPNVGDVEKARALSGQCRSQLLQAFQVISTAADQLDLSAARVHVQYLKSLGAELRQVLLPIDAIQLLTDPRQSITHVVFRHDPSLSNLAFEHIVLGDEAHGNDFLVFRYGVGRDVLTQNQAQIDGAHASRANTYHGFGIVDPSNLLARKGASSLAKETWDFFGKWPHLAQISFQRKLVGRPVSKDWVRQAVQESDIGTIVSHFCFDREHPERSGFMLAEGLVYTAQDLVHDLAQGTAPLDVLLAVGCESGSTDGWDRQWIDDSRIWGMVDAVRRAGVRHYIGTSVPFPAVAAARVISPFHEGLAEGKTIGHALRDTREKLRENSPGSGGDVLGLAFLLYGLPQTPYLCADGHRVTPNTGHFCTSLDGGNICGRIVCPQDSGFGNLDAAGLLQPQCSLHFRAPQRIRCSAGHLVATTDDLCACSSNGCRNTVCQACSGHGNGLCWEHACHDQGHPILGNARKTCPDPYGLHPDEKRSMCPKDDGWIGEGLCRECLTHRHSQGHNNQCSCPHCGLDIDEKNAWAGKCDDCGKRLCISCEPWYKKTMCCRDTTRSRQDRYAGWVRSLERRSKEEKTLAAPSRLDEIHALADKFQENLRTNIVDQTRRLDPMPVFSLSAWDAVMPEPRILLGVTPSDKDKDKELSDSLFKSLLSQWSLPKEPGMNEQWRPPETEWLEPYRQTIQLKLLTLRSLWGRPVVAALATVAPIAWELGKGPTLVPCAERHLVAIQECLKENLDGAPDMYLVVFSATEWAAEVKPTYQPGPSGLLRVHVHHEGNGWCVTSPPLDGMPSRVQDFVTRLVPKSIYELRQECRKVIEAYLEDHDFITQDKAESQIEVQAGHPVQRQDVDEVFNQLVSTGKYRRHDFNGKRSLQTATAQELGWQRTGRWWLQITIALLVVAIGLSGVILSVLHGYWGFFAVGVVACTAAGGYVAKKFFRFLGGSAN